MQIGAIGVDTKDIEWSTFTTDETPNTVHPNKPGIRNFVVASHAGDSHFSSCPQHLKCDNNDYLKSETYFKAKAYRGYVDRTRVLLHKLKGAI